jgi:3-oxoisoapionate decarboxylase
MRWTRRELLALGVGNLCAALATADPPAAAARQRMGIVIHSYGIRRSKDRRFDDPLTFLDHCRTLGAGGAQTSIGVRDDAYAAKVRQWLVEQNFYLEGSISLPRNPDDVPRFDAEVQTANRCGATIFRTVLMNGRRYEVFNRPDDFRKFLEQAKQSLAWARPVVEKHEVRMAVENHKDLQAPELLDVIAKIGSPLIGVCIDTGNSIALLESALETATLLAPHAFTTHLKDMGVDEYADGFLLAEVPLGDGYLDLPKIVATLRKARPEIRWNLEMITRDPLKIPCLMPKYWATLETVPARRLAQTLTDIRAHPRKQPLPRISALGSDEQLRVEDENVRRSLQFAHEKLGM